MPRGGQRPIRISLLILAAFALIACDARSTMRARSLERTTGDTIDLAATRADSIVRARTDSANRARPGYVVDSILPLEEELRRFRATIAEAPHALADGAPDRETLASRFVAALARDDSTALGAMRLSRAEFAYLVYPESRFTRPPYRSAPGLVWRQIRDGSDRGLIRLRRRLAGQPLRLQRLICQRPPEREGSNRLWPGCRVHMADASGHAIDARLFGSIIERDGRFKFVSYANDL